MPTIKGPIHIKNGDISQLFKDNNIKVKLPFTATGWKSTKTPEGADMSGIELTKDKPKAEKKVEEPKSKAKQVKKKTK